MRLNICTDNIRAATELPLLPAPAKIGPTSEPKMERHLPQMPATGMVYRVTWEVNNAYPRLINIWQCHALHRARLPRQKLLMATLASIFSNFCTKTLSDFSVPTPRLHSWTEEAGVNEGSFQFQISYYNNLGTDLLGCLFSLFCAPWFVCFSLPFWLYQPDRGLRSNKH